MSFTDRISSTKAFSSQVSDNSNFVEGEGQLPAKNGVDYRNSFDYRTSVLVYRPVSTEAYVEQINSIRFFTDGL